MREFPVDPPTHLSTCHKVESATPMESQHYQPIAQHLRRSAYNSHDRWVVYHTIRSITVRAPEIMIMSLLITGRDVAWPLGSGGNLQAAITQVCWKFPNYGSTYVIWAHATRSAGSWSVVYGQWSSELCGVRLRPVIMRNINSMCVSRHVAVGYLCGWSFSAQMLS